MDIESPFICCSHCGQRVLLRIDEYPTYHLFNNGLVYEVCPTSWPKRLMTVTP